MVDHELLSDLEKYIEMSFGVRVEHMYDRRILRRFFSKLSFNPSEADDRPASSKVLEQWPPLDLFRNAYIQREALAALRMRTNNDVQLANLLIPVLVRTDHFGVTQGMFDSIMRAYLLDRHARKRVPLPQIHQEFASLLLLSLVSDRVMIVETDFSHERNMALKYTVRPLEDKVLRTPPVARRSNLFFSKEIASAVKSSAYIGIHGNFSEIFNREIGHSDLEGVGEHGGFGPDANAGFLVIAGRRRDYTCAYIAPLYSLINRQSSVIRRIQTLFDTFLDVLENEAFYRIERNKHHSRLRHTIGVEVHHLTTSYNEIFDLRSRILDNFEGDTYALNIQLAKVNGLISDLSRDVTKQFGTEFDIFGNRRSKRDEMLEPVRLPPKQFYDLIKTVMQETARRRHNAHFLLEFEHKASVELASDTSLVICFTELFNNALKYNVAGERIRVRTRDRGDVVIVTISNIGPSLSKQEAELMPLMGLRGMNSQRLVDEGSGQGLATVFSILEDIGVDADYRQRALTKEQQSKLVSEFGSRRVAGLDLSAHSIELTFPISHGVHQ